MGIDVDAHPTIKHTLTSQSIPMSIEVKIDGYRGERIKDSQTQDIEQFKAMMMTTIQCTTTQNPL